MTKICVFVVCFCWLFQPSNIKAQDSSEVARADVLLVIFEPKMYRSTIDPEISKGSGIPYHQVRQLMRTGLDDNMFLELKAKYSVKSLLREDTTVNQDQLNVVYNQIGYKYVALEEVDKKKPEQKKLDDDADFQEKVNHVGDKVEGFFKDKFSKKDKKEDEKMGTWVQDGQVVSRIDNREKYMQTYVSNPATIKRICDSYQVKNILFISQLDLLKSNSEFKEGRKFKIHYSIYDASGAFKKGGVQSAEFSTTQNDIKEIVNLEFYKATNTIAKQL